MPSWRRHALVEALAAVALVVGLIATTARSEAPAKPMSTAMGATGAGEVTFDHKIHAGDYRIPCLDCHAFADKSPVAGVPSGRKCMGCHKFVAKDKPAIEVLAQHTQDGEPLRWPRVFALPDFIHFTHRMHVRAQVACAECHGDVAAKHLVTQDQPFTMGRCVSCHEERHASRDCLTCHK